MYGVQTEVGNTSHCLLWQFVVFLIFVTGSASAAKISITVTDMNGVQVTGATVTLYQAGHEYVHQNNPGMTDVTGYYEFSGLPDGAYNVQADKSGYFSPSDSAVLRAMTCRST